MWRFPDLISRHRVDPGHLVHVGVIRDQEVSYYYEAGFSHITVAYPDPMVAKVIRTRFPGVDVNMDEERRLDAIAPDARVLVVRTPGNEVSTLLAAPWSFLDLIIVETCTAIGDDPASTYDLVTEIVTTRGFVEVERWTRDFDSRHSSPADDVLNVVYVKGARL